MSRRRRRPRQLRRRFRPMTSDANCTRGRHQRAVRCADVDAMHYSVRLLLVILGLIVVGWLVWKHVKHFERRPKTIAMAGARSAGGRRAQVPGPGGGAALREACERGRPPRRERPLPGNVRTPRRHRPGTRHRPVRCGRRPGRQDRHQARCLQLAQGVREGRQEGPVRTARSRCTCWRTRRSTCADGPTRRSRSATGMQYTAQVARGLGAPQPSQAQHPRRVLLAGSCTRTCPTRIPRPTASTADGSTYTRTPTSGPRRPPVTPRTGAQAVSSLPQYGSGGEDVERVRAARPASRRSSRG